MLIMKVAENAAKDSSGRTPLYQADDKIDRSEGEYSNSCGWQCLLQHHLIHIH